jgi:ComEC/Rec2-related protein
MQAICNYIEEIEHSILLSRESKKASCMHLKTLVALLGIISGIIIGEKTIYGSEVAVISLFVGCIQVILYFSELRKMQDNQREKTYRSSFSIPLTSGIFFIAVFVSIIRMQFNEEKNNFICLEACSFIATINSSSKIQNEYQIFSVTPANEMNVYDVQIKTPLYPRYEMGEKVLLFGKVTLPNNSMSHDGTKSFDYEMYLRTHSIGSEMIYPKIEPHIDDTKVVGHHSSVVSKLQHLREVCVHSISLYVSEPASSLSSGMLFGATTMSKELIQTFRVAGLSHIVVLSGFNIAILISFVLAILVFVPLFIRVVTAGIFVTLFVLAVGGEASIIRATLMSFIGLIALLSGSAYTARQALLLSLIIIVLYEPIHLLHDVSLHLSFLATAGIVYMSGGIKNRLKKITSTTYKEIIATTLSAYVATLPYVMYTFGTVSIYALITNLVVLPLVPIVMLSTFLVVVFAPMTHMVALLFGYLTTVLCTLIIWIAKVVELLPFSSVAVTLSLIEMYFLYGLLIVLYIFFILKEVNKEKNETSLTKNDEIISEIIYF